MPEINNSHIVAIGGGEIDLGETEVIDRHLLSLTETAKPKVLFLPPPSEEERQYSDKFKVYYESLGAHAVEHLLLSQNPSADEVENKIGETDAIYIGGGSTKQLLAGLRDTGVDEQLKQRVAKGVVAGGVSAGANVWFENASSGERDTGYSIVPGMAVVRNAIVSPHFSSERDVREPALQAQLKTIGRKTFGIAIDDFAAYMVRPGELRDPQDGYVVAQNQNSVVRAYSQGTATTVRRA